MAENKCPLCESPCIVKIVAAGDKRYCEVDVCKSCGAIYPRGKVEARATPKKRSPAKGKARGRK